MAETIPDTSRSLDARVAVALGWKWRRQKNTGHICLIVPAESKWMTPPSEAWEDCPAGADPLADGSAYRGWDTECFRVVATGVVEYLPRYSTDPGAALVALAAFCAANRISYQIACDRVWGPNPVTVTMWRHEAENYNPRVAFEAADTFSLAVCGAILAVQEKTR